MEERNISEPDQACLNSLEAALCALNMRLIIDEMVLRIQALEFGRETMIK